MRTQVLGDTNLTKITARNRKFLGTKLKFPLVKLELHAGESIELLVLFFFFETFWVRTLITRCNFDLFNLRILERGIRIWDVGHATLSWEVLYDILLLINATIRHAE